MWSMKVAISLPDPLFKAADALAHKLKKSRSELYADAIAEYVGSRGARAVTAKLNEVYSGQPSNVETALAYAQFASLARETW
jgi:metal-responsive CopG/Arc/MetJ family transcriptional regulator